MVIMNQPFCLGMDMPHKFLGAESFVFSMLNRVESDLAMTTSSLCCLKLDPSLRKRIADTVMPTSKIKVCICSARLS